MTSWIVTRAWQEFSDHLMISTKECAVALKVLAQLAAKALEEGEEVEAEYEARLVVQLFRTTARRSKLDPPSPLIDENLEPPPGGGWQLLGVDTHMCKSGSAMLAAATWQRMVVLDGDRTEERNDDDDGDGNGR